jgi:hypothetical protein
VLRLAQGKPHAPHWLFFSEKPPSLQEDGFNFAEVERADAVSGGISRGGVSR